MLRRAALRASALAPRQCRPATQAAAVSLPPVVEVRSEPELNAVVASSRETPLLLLVHQSSPACNTAISRLAQLVRGARGVRMGVVSSAQVPGVAEALHLARLPAVALLRAERVVEVLQDANDAAQLAALVRRAAPPRPAAPGAGDPIEAGFAALNAGRVEDAAALFAAALDTSAPPGRARCLAGLSRCALATGDAESAKELASQARATALEPPPAPVPFEVVAAEAYLTLTALAQADAEAQAQAQGAQAPGAAEAGPEAAAAAARSLALASFADGRLDEALDAALLLVRRHRAYDGGVGTTLAARLAEVQPTAEKRAAARRRLSSLLFI